MKQHSAHRILIVFSLASAMLAASFPAAAQHAPRQPRHCLDLAGVQIPPAEIGLPTDGAMVQTASTIGATTIGNQDGDYCRLTGVIRAKTAGTPDIRFEMNLPDRWNRRALQFRRRRLQRRGRDRHRPDAVLARHRAARPGLRHLRRRFRPYRQPGGRQLRHARRGRHELRLRASEEGPRRGARADHARLRTRARQDVFRGRLDGRPRSLHGDPALPRRLRRRDRQRARPR